MTYTQRRTSSMVYPLEAPNGWFLLEMKHHHTRIVYATDHHEPVPHPDGPWEVIFQKYPKGGRATSGRGHSMEEAWRRACEAVRRDELGPRATKGDYVERVANNQGIVIAVGVSKTPGDDQGMSQTLLCEPLEPPKVSDTLVSEARSQGYSGDVCVHCQGSRLKWAGHCMVCDDCGETTGCS